MKTVPSLVWIGICVFICSPAGAGQPPPTLQKLADEMGAKVSKKLLAESTRASIVAVVVEGDQALLGREGRIAQELERLLVFRLESAAAVQRAVPLGGRQGRQALERARVAGVDLLLHCVIGLKKDRIHLSADLSPARVPFWDRLLDPVPRGSKHHLFVSATVDEEIDLLLGQSRAPPALGSWHMDELLYVPGKVLDVGLGDLDGRAGAEMVLLYENAIEVFAVKEGKAERLATYDLNVIPSSLVRTRDPAGSLLVVDFNRDGRFEIFYKHFNLRWGEVLTWTGVRLRSLRRLKMVPLCQFSKEGRPVVLYGTPEPGTNRYLATVELADINASKGTSHVLAEQFVSLRCWQSEDDLPALVAIDAIGNLVRLGTDWREDARIAMAGAGSGVVDLDLDGKPEMVLSDPVWPDEKDRVRVVSQGEIVWRSTDVVGAVVAVASGDLAGDGKAQAILAAVEAGGRASRIYLLGR